jgi:hypothetical protein
MGSKSRLWCDRCIVTRAPGSRGNSYFTGGRSGLSAHLRAVGSCSGSSAQLVQTYRSFRSPISSRTAFIGLPQAGHAFRTGSDTGIWFSPAMAVYVRRHRDLKTVAESCMGLPTLLDSKTAGYSTRGSDCVGGVMGQEFYESLAQRVRVIAEKADPFTRRRLLGLAKRYDAKGGPWAIWSN